MAARGSARTPFLAGDAAPDNTPRSSRITRRDQEELIRLARVSTGLHHPWIHLPTTPAEFEAYIPRFDQPTAEGLLVCVSETGAIAGQININNIVRGHFQCGALGYAAFAPTAGRGYMSQGLGLALYRAFGELGLHRLEANIQPAKRPGAFRLPAGHRPLAGAGPGPARPGSDWRR